MAEMGENQPATPSVLLELREERQVMQEGYRFLDEKRLLLAAEVLSALERYEALETRFLADYRLAAEALAAAAGQHGLDGLQVYPATLLDDAEVEVERRNFLGVRLIDAELRLVQATNPPPEHEPVAPSPEARRCAELFRGLLDASVELAAIQANLERMLAEYRRTQRRARALEDVLLPEIDGAIRRVAERLEELEQEEAIRVRLAPASGAGR